MLKIRRDDPFGELSAAVCNLVAGSLELRHFGVIALDEAALEAASSEFLRLPDGSRAAAVAAVIDAVLKASFAEGDPTSSQLVEVPVEPQIGSSCSALLFPETEMIVFAVGGQGGAAALAPLHRAAVLALPMIYRIADLRGERRQMLSDKGLLNHVEELAHIGGWEQTAANGRLTWSEAIYAIHGLEPGGEVTLDKVLQLYPSPAREKLSREMERAVAEGGSFEVTSPIRTPSGEDRIVRTVGRSDEVDGGRRLYGITEDVTRQLSVERRLWWAANRDPVTGLPNRLLFEDRLAVALERAKREGRGFALMVVEIDDLARMHRRAGYTLPDKNMMDIASRIASVTRDSDTVARLSVSEFALILCDVNDVAALQPATSRLKQQVAEVRAGGAADEPIAMSCGVAFYPSHADTGDELIRAAEMALSRAKRVPDDPIVIYDREVAHDIEKRRLTILGRARESLTKGEFVPYYQPQVDIETGVVVGAEALVRWQTADALLDAKDFAYALDDHEVGSQVGRQVLDQVIADVAKLRQTTDRPFRVSVNASRTEVLRNDFLDTFLEKTRAGNLDPTDFIIEITEDVIIGVDDQTLHNKISFLVSSGVEFSLDDFGTGYASLIHISTFPVKEVKIDKQFVVGIETDRRKRAIVQGIVGIARSMGLNVIAEGVETPAQQEALRDLGCRYVQGYLHAFPLPFPRFAEMVGS